MDSPKTDLPPEEQKVYDQKVKDELMQKQITWGTMK